MAEYEQMHMHDAPVVAAREGCRYVPAYVLEAAMCELSPARHAEHMKEIFCIAPNPFPSGRENETAKSLKAFERHCKGLIWC